MEVRDAREQDLEAILAIYNDVVATSTAIYRDDPYTLADRRQWWLDRVRQHYPVLVVTERDDAIGFSSFGDFRPWPGYRFTVETHHHGEVRQAWAGGRNGTDGTVAPARCSSR